MRIVNCPICNNPFVKKARDICPKCIQLEIDMLAKVRSCLRDNPKAKLTYVAEETGVSVKMINRFIREGQLNLMVSCGKCGIKIKNTNGKKYCNTCAALVKKGIMSSSERLSMERKVKEEKMKEIEQQQTNNTLRKSLYGLNSGHNK